jgi:hypothetical protein
MGTSPLESPSLKGQLMSTATALKEERDGLMARVMVIDDQLRAIEVLTGESLVPAGALQPLAPRQDPTTLPEMVIHSLGMRLGGKTAREIVGDFAGTPFETRHANNPNGLYNTLSRLVASNRIARHNGRYYLPETLASIERGELQEEMAEGEGVEGTSVPDLILRVLSAHPTGINARGVMRALRNIPEGLERLERNSQVAYAALSRMVQNGVIVRDGSIYRRPAYGATPAADPPSEARGSLFPSQDTGGGKVVN